MPGLRVLKLAVVTSLAFTVAAGPVVSQASQPSAKRSAPSAVRASNLLAVDAASKAAPRRLFFLRDCVVWSAQANGSSPRVEVRPKLTRANRQCIKDFDVSPNGRRVLLEYAVGADSKSGIAVLTRGRPRTFRWLTPATFHYEPRWSNDGRKIVWWSADKGLRVMGADGTASRALNLSPVFDTAVWQDGRLLVGEGDAIASYADDGTDREELIRAGRGQFLQPYDGQSNLLLFAIFQRNRSDVLRLGGIEVAQRNCTFTSAASSSSGAVAFVACGGGLTVVDPFAESSRPVLVARSVSRVDWD